MTQQTHPAAPAYPPHTGFSDRSVVQGGPRLEITLITGDRVPYRLSMDSLAAMEEIFGSLPEMNRRLHQALDEYNSDNTEESAGGRIALLRVVADLIAIGVRHVPWTDPITGETLRLGTNRQLCHELLDPSRLQEYMTVTGDAMRAAFGGQGGGVNPPTPAPAPAPQDSPTMAPSPGGAGTTSPPLSTGVPMPPFGP